jgi:amidase
MYLRIFPIAFLLALTACKQQPEQAATESEPASASKTAASSIYQDAVAHPNRRSADHDRDAGRKPAEVLAFFGIGSSTFAAVSGYANITVPAGFVSGLPIGMSFIGTAFSEKTLIEIAYAFEQAGMVRRPPPLE